MKTFLFIVFLVLPVSIWAQSVKKKKIYHVVNKFFIDLNNDYKIDTIILSSSLDNKNSFNRVSILMSGAKRTTFKAKDSWAEIDNWFLDSNKNCVKSKNIFIKKTEKHTVIILSAGTDGAGYGGEFSIINIENDSVKMVFDHNNDTIDVELPYKLIDLESNGRLCFIFSDLGEIYKQVKNGYLGTYHPYFIYPVDNDCRLNKALTKSYNEKHYIFAGFENSEKIKIFYPDNKKLKPRVWKE